MPVSGYGVNTPWFGHCTPTKLALVAAVSLATQIPGAGDSHMAAKPPSAISSGSHHLARNPGESSHESKISTVRVLPDPTVCRAKAAGFGDDADCLVESPFSVGSPSAWATDSSAYTLKGTRLCCAHPRTNGGFDLPDSPPSRVAPGNGYEDWITYGCVDRTMRASFAAVSVFSGGRLRSAATLTVSQFPSPKRSSRLDVMPGPPGRKPNSFVTT